MITRTTVLTSRVDNQAQGYVRHEVEGDGNCGYTAFGMTRENALRLLLDNVSNISNIIKIPVKHALLTDEFYQYLRRQNIITISKEELWGDEQLLMQYTTDLAVQSAYIEYDVRDRSIDAGYSHPAVLQALADIQKIELHMWQLNENDALRPHVLHEENYAAYIPPRAENRIDLLFVNGNHFDRLEIQGYRDDIPSEGIYPLKTSWGYGAVSDASSMVLVSDSTHIVDEQYIENIKNKISQFMVIFSCNLMLKNYDINDPLVGYLAKYNFQHQLDEENIAFSACAVSTAKVLWPEFSEKLTFESGATHVNIEERLAELFQSIDFSYFKQQIRSLLYNFNPVFGRFFDSAVALFTPNRNKNFITELEEIQKPDPVLEEMAQFLLSEKEASHGRSFKDFNEVFSYEGRRHLEEFLCSFNFSAVSVKTIQELLIRRSLMKDFTKAIMEAVSSGGSSLSSKSLALLELMIDDFISPKQKALWLFDGAHNYGYEYSGETLQKKISETNFTLQMSFIVINHLDSLADALNSMLENTLSPGFYLENIETEENREKLLLLYELWKIQFDKLFDQTYSSAFKLDELRIEPTYTKPILSLQLTIIWYFEYWMIEDFLKQNSDVVKLEEIKRRLCSIRKFDGLPYNILEYIYGDETSAILRREFKSFTHSLKEFVTKIIISRDIENDKTFQAVFGIGFSGEMFSANKQGIDGKVFITMSSKYSEHYHRLLLKLIQDRINKLLEENKMDSIKTFLASYEEEHALVHKHIARYILKKVYQSPQNIHQHVVRVWRHVLAKNARDKIRNCKNLIMKDEKRIVQLKGKKRLTEQDNVEIKQKEQHIAALLAEIKHLNHVLYAEHDLSFTVSNEVFLVLQEQFDTEKRSLCVESMISLSSHNNHYIPVVFRRNHPESLSNNGSLITIGQFKRRVIPPCNELCQLFAPAHLLWATLLSRNLNLQELHDHAIQHGKRGVIPLQEQLFQSEKFEADNSIPTKDEYHDAQAQKVGLTFFRQKGVQILKRVNSDSVLYLG